MWWQIASIALVGGMAILLTLGLAWYFRRHFFAGRSLPTSAGKVSPKKELEEKPRQQQQEQTVIFCGLVREILATKPSADALPELLADLSRSSLQPHEGPFAPEPFLVDTDFSRLQLKCLLGAGGFGRVQLVAEPEPDSFAAWKAVDKKTSEKIRNVQSVMNERLVLAATKICPNPFIVDYHGCCQTRKYFYFKMEPLLGGELYKHYHKKNLHGSEDHARYYMACALSGVDHLHSLQVMLRSLKPEDCMLDARGMLRLTDFGMSKFLVGKTYTTCGTPDYFSPEIIASGGHSFPVDWWCAGVMLFELLAGHPPFESPYPMQIYQKVMSGIGRVKFPSAVRRPAADLVCSLCQAEPTKRLPEERGFDSVKQHKFFHGIAWAELAGMTPPLVPGGDYQANFDATAEDLPPGFTGGEGAGTDADYSLEFGPEGATDEFPDEPPRHMEGGRNCSIQFRLPDATEHVLHEAL